MQKTIVTLPVGLSRKKQRKGLLWRYIKELSWRECVGERECVCVCACLYEAKTKVKLRYQNIR